MFPRVHQVVTDFVWLLLGANDVRHKKPKRNHVHGRDKLQKRFRWHFSASSLVRRKPDRIFICSLFKAVRCRLIHTVAPAHLSSQYYPISLRHMNELSTIKVFTDTDWAPVETESEVRRGKRVPSNLFLSPTLSVLPVSSHWLSTDGSASIHSAQQLIWPRLPLCGHNNCLINDHWRVACQSRHNAG